MKTRFRKTLIGAAIAAACAMTAPAQAVTGVLFDVNGALGPNTVGTDRFFIDVFDWGPGNTLATDATSPADNADSFILSQATLSQLQFGGDNIFGYPTNGVSPSGITGAELTFQMQAFAEVATGADGLEWTENGGAGIRFFDIFYDGGRDSNHITGCGFGTHITAPCAADGSVLILSGVISVTGMNWNPTTTTGLLDQFGGSDNQAGVTTVSAQGSGNFTVEVTFTDPTFFLTPVTTVGVDMTHSSQNADPFSGQNPSNQVVGRNIGDAAALLDATYGTDRVNDLACPAPGSGGADGVCDIHTQADSNTNILSSLVPEPGSLALLGLGLGALGFIGRRRRIGA